MNTDTSTNRRSSALARLASVAVALAIATSACGTTATKTQVDPLSGRYRVSGGGGTIPEITKLTTRFTELHPGVLWDIENVGSDAAIASVQRNEADLGGVSREMTAAEKQAVAQLQIGVSGTGVAVSAGHSVSDLTKDQIRAIFAGEIKNWSQVGGTPGEIKVFVREPTAATRQIFDQYIFDGKSAYRSDYTPVDSADSTLKSLYSFQDGVSMLTITAKTLADPKIKLLKVNGVAPTIADLTSGAYPMRRPLYMVYSASAGTLKPAIAALVEFAKSPEGQKLLASK
ncbi:MAG TPA: substrate-binding domain-containing protein [Candidatus Limnocylindria bacterium]|nr:substrate-binding domain-containing protein [Candidatus Limnocylindria bacterium]